MKPIYLLITVFGFAACHADDTTTPATIKTDSATNFHPAPVIHDSLSAAQLEKIKKIQEAFAEVNPSSLEETIADFKKDSHPDNEITLWLVMANTYKQFTAGHKELSPVEKQEAYKLILTRSMWDESNAKQQAQLRLLTDNDVAEIFLYYNAEAEKAVGR